MFNGVAGCHPDFQNYVNEVVNAIRTAPAGIYFDSSLHEMVYLILGLEPFPTWLSDPARRLRIGRLTKLIEAFSSMPVPNHPNVSRGSLRILENAGEIVPGWVRQFYHLFIGYLNDAGIDDIEDEDVICPQGMVPVMTMHQAKGLK